MKTKIFLVLTIAMLSIISSCKKQDTYKQYRCSCMYTAQGSYGGGPYSGHDTVTVTASSQQDAITQCKDADELSIPLGDQMLSDDCSVIY